MARRSARNRSAYVLIHLMNNLSKAYLSGIFYCLLAYQSTHASFYSVAVVARFWRWSYQLIALATFIPSLILSDRRVLLKLGSPPWLSPLFSRQAQRFLGLVFSQCWLMITLDMLALNRSHRLELTATNNYIPFSAFVISMATATSCFLSAAV